MHPCFRLESGIGRARSQESVAGTGVLVELFACVNALLVFWLELIEACWIDCGHFCLGS